MNEVWVDKQFREGWNGESIIREYLTKKGIHHLQADLMVFIKGNWQIWEIKHQECFKKPPFDGHGLPKWQIDARLKFQEDTGIRALLFIVDKMTSVIYWQYMDELIKGKSYQTSGNNPRIIFPLESYNILED
jgi:hypothetical protein